jgi:hypothetical protein
MTSSAALLRVEFLFTTKMVTEEGKLGIPDSGREMVKM